jgi:predicted GH43/DUF377 family glycosyl hydrolase
MRNHVHLTRTGIVLAPSSDRVLIRPFETYGETRTTKVIARVMALSDEDVDHLLSEVMEEFGERHREIEDFFMRRYEHVKRYMLTDSEPSQPRKLLIGSYFTSEYALECAALFNPSMVPHPDQEGLEEGELRFIMSLRATGEGHISSITFRSGVIKPDGLIDIDPASRFVTEPERTSNPEYDKYVFELKLYEMKLYNDFSKRVLEPLGESFTLKELRTSIAYERARARQDFSSQTVAEGLLMLAESNYGLQFDEWQPVSERTIFPSSPSNRNGIEDARFVRFVEDDGQVTYYATFSAFDGKVVLPELLETSDFLAFKISTLNGPAVQNKGMALFPRRIGGRYCMVSRQDNENIYLMYSDNIHFWHETIPIVRPTYPWEFVQLGNCGSPIETDQGWLLLSHGVGSMRKYCIGAFLLDRDDPTKLLGRTKEPLLAPNENEREGYVPNVVYTCGAIAHNDNLVIPYAMSDYASSIAVMPIDALLSRLD